MDAVAKNEDGEGALPSRTLPPKPDRTSFIRIRAKYRVQQTKYNDVENQRLLLQRELTRTESKLERLQKECDLILDQIANPDGARYETVENKDILPFLESLEVSKKGNGENNADADADAEIDADTELDEELDAAGEGELEVDGEREEFEDDRLLDIVRHLATSQAQQLQHNHATSAVSPALYNSASGFPSDIHEDDFQTDERGESMSAESSSHQQA